MAGTYKYKYRKIQANQLHPRDAWRKQKRRLDYEIPIGRMASMPRPKYELDGRRLAKDGTNFAVPEEAMKELAAEPVRLSVDRFGKRIMEGEDSHEAAVVPFSTKDAFGIQSARVPRSYEELRSRYFNVDKIMAKDLNLDAVKKAFLERDGKDDERAVQTFSWDSEEGRELRGGQPAAIMLIGVAPTSARSRKLAGRAVFEVAPSGLLVQLCREQVGRRLVMPEEHLRAAADFSRGFETGNPSGYRRRDQTVLTLRFDEVLNAEFFSYLAYGTAVDEFAQADSTGPMPKTLCLGDVHQSRLEVLRQQEGNESIVDVPARMARSKQLVRGLIALAAMGHQRVLGIIDHEQMSTAVTWLERADARLVAVADASDIEAGRETLAGDIQRATELQRKGTSAKPPLMVLGFGRSRLGAFLNEKGLEFIKKRKQRVKALTRVQDLVKIVPRRKQWKVAQLFAGGGDMPGPMAKFEEAKEGWRFMELLEIPDHYMRDIGMGRHAPELWRSLLDAGGALETRDATELDWWAAGGHEGRATTGSPFDTPGDEWAAEDSGATADAWGYDVGSSWGYDAESSASSRGRG